VVSNPGRGLGVGELVDAVAVAVDHDELAGQCEGAMVVEETSIVELGSTAVAGSRRRKSSFRCHSRTHS